MKPLTCGRSLGPSQQLHVWRMLGGQGTNGLRTVTVLWKVMCQSNSLALTFIVIWLLKGTKIQQTTETDFKLSDCRNGFLIFIS